MTVDPVFALQSRLSRGPKGLYAWVVALGASYLLLGQQTAGRGAADVAALLLAMGLPYAAVQIRLLEGRGQIDLLRLTGRDAAEILGWLVLGGCWWLLAAGVLLLLPAVWQRHWEAVEAVSFPLGAAAAAVLLSVPARPTRRWLTIALVPILGFLAGRAIVVGSPSVVALSAALSTLTAICCIPGAIAVIERPTPMAAASRRSSTRRRSLLRTTGHAERARMLLNDGRGLLIVVVLEILLTPPLMWWASRRELGAGDEGVVVFLCFPFLALAFLTSMRARDEALSGGIDRMRLSSASGWRTGADFLTGIGVASIAFFVPAVATLAVVDPWRALRPAAVALLIAVPLVALAGTEGLRKRTTGLYIGPAILGLVIFGLNGLNTWRVLLLLSWVPVAIAIRSVARPGDAPLGGPVAVAASATVAGAMGALYNPWFWTSISWPAGAMALFAGLIGRPRTAARRGVFLLALIVATGMAAALSQRLSVLESRRFIVPLTVPAGDTNLRHPLIYAALFGAFAAAGLVFGMLVDRVAAGNPRTAFAARAVPLAVPTLVWAFFDDARLRALRSTAQVPLVIDEWLFVALVAGIALLWFMPARRDRAPAVHA